MKSQAGFSRPLTSLIGRERTVVQVVALLNDPAVRLLTLTGPGGIGKTRLAMRVADETVRDFEDGVVSVELASLADPRLVPVVIAHALGIDANTMDSLESDLIDRLRDRELLLIVDNFEHLLPASASLMTLLGECPGLVCLVTSRQRLGVFGEYVVNVQPLSLPTTLPFTLQNNVMASEAGQLFVERATATDPAFRLTEQNAGDIALLCRRLDGLPLAIELAASRIETFSPRDMLDSFVHLLPVLETDSATIDHRHRTMRETIAWSYRMLDPVAQSVFRSLSVFAGGFTIETAGAVGHESLAIDHATGDDVALHRVLTALVNRHLVQRLSSANDRYRFTLLEVIREFALEQVAEHGHLASAASAHAGLFLKLAQELRPKLRGPDPDVWLSRLDDEIDNFRAALAWFLDVRPQGDLDAIKLCNALGHYWRLRGYTAEAVQSLRLALNRAPHIENEDIAAAHLYLGHLEHEDLTRSLYHYETSLALFRLLGNQRQVAGLLTCVAMTAEQMGRFDDALDYLRESMASFADLSDQLGIAQVNYHLGSVLAQTGDLTAAKNHLATARLIWDRFGDEINGVFAIVELGRVCRLAGQFAEASDLLEWAVQRLERSRIAHGQGAIRRQLGTIALALNDHVRAMQESREAIRLLRVHAIFDNDLASAIETVIRVAIDHDRAGDVISLAAAVDYWRETNEAAREEADVGPFRSALHHARNTLGLTEFTRQWNKGQLLTIQEASDLARTLEIPIHPPPTSSSRTVLPFAEHLTPREQRVLCLVAAGLSNQEIAAELGISVRTVTTHTQNVFGKLGVDNRTHAAALSFHYGLCEVPSHNHF